MWIGDRGRGERRGTSHDTGLGTGLAVIKSNWVHALLGCDAVLHSSSGETVVLPRWSTSKVYKGIRQHHSSLYVCTKGGGERGFPL